MKKNYFKILMAIAIMVMTGVSFTSCDEQLDNPVVDPTEAETEEPVIVETATGVEITINKLSAVSSFIDELKTVIEKFQTENPGKQFVLDIETTATLEATETDYTLLIPNLSEFNIVINLNGNLVTSAKPLTLKLDQKAGTRDEVGEKIKTNYDNVITLNLKNDDIDLILDVPGTTVFINKLNSIQILNGVSVVKDGGSINTYVWAPTRNDYEMRNGEPEWVEFTASGDDWSSSYYRPNVSYTNGATYCFKNLKIVKGKADYAKIYVWDENRKLDKLTIAEGATVVLNEYPIVKEIVGEGNGATVKMSTYTSWRDEGSKETHNYCGLYYVDKISNVNIVPLEPSDGDPFKDYTQFVSLNDVPANIEGDAIKFFTNISFRDPESASTIVKNCKFEPVQYKEIQICVPFQTEEISSFKFTFENCEFVEGAKISNYVRSEKDVKDADGNYVYQDCNIYYWVDGQDEPQYVWLVSDLPADVAAAGKLTYDEFYNGERPNGYFAWGTTTVTEPVEYNNYYVFISFTNCKYAGAALTKDTKFYNTNSQKGVNFRYEIDGVIYQLVKLYDDGGETMLIPAV